MDTCTRCKGSGVSPEYPDKFCGRCSGMGVNGPDFNYRGDGRVERVCEHGVGHTVCIKAMNDPGDWPWSHGCDGCCPAYERYE